MEKFKPQRGKPLTKEGTFMGNGEDEKKAPRENHYL
jgi:hypothetical protein